MTAPKRINWLLPFRYVKCFVKIRLRQAFKLLGLGPENGPVLRRAYLPIGNIAAYFVARLFRGGGFDDVLLEAGIIGTRVRAAAFNSGHLRWQGNQSTSHQILASHFHLNPRL
jgi:hypothetical protein